MKTVKTLSPTQWTASDWQRVLKYAALVLIGIIIGTAVF